VMGAVGQDRAGVASGVNNAVARTAGLLAVAIFGIVVTQVFYGVVASNLGALHLAPDIANAMSAQRDKLAGATIPAGLPAATHHAIQASLNDAFIIGFRVAMLLGAALAFASAGITALFIRDERKS